METFLELLAQELALLDLEAVVAVAVVLLELLALAVTAHQAQ
jgi:hypothetical protein